MISVTAARVIASWSTAAARSRAMNSPPRACQPSTHRAGWWAAFETSGLRYPCVNQLAHRGLIGDVGEERVLALMQHAAVEPERCGRETDHLQRRIDRAQRIEKRRYMVLDLPGIRWASSISTRSVWPISRARRWIDWMPANKTRACASRLPRPAE